MDKNDKVNLKAFSERELMEFIQGVGLPPFRARQLIHWIYRRYAATIEEITEFSGPLRKKLSERAYISSLGLVGSQKSRDGTTKYLFRLEDGEMIESVLIPDRDRLTLCISSQVGCAMGCKFCLTGRVGLKRNLRAFEIVDQIIYVSRLILPERLTNIVFMGMGEPLANFDEVVESLWRITRLMGISKRRITLSTSGIVPALLELPVRAPSVNIAISLNATSDIIRDEIMPVNRVYPLRMLLDACRSYPLEPRRRITFEYILLDGVNDSIDDARRLISLLKGIRCKINLIPFNAYEGAEFRSPSDKKVMAFQKMLIDGGLTALIRKSKGQDIRAACGQLRAGYITDR
jgi:23S rRNA (adenine2503-C2)-methyltransferase